MIHSTVHQSYICCTGVTVQCCCCAWSTMEMGFVDRPFVFPATLEAFHHHCHCRCHHHQHRRYHNCHHHCICLHHCRCHRHCRLRYFVTITIFDSSSISCIGWTQFVTLSEKSLGTRKEFMQFLRLLIVGWISPAVFCLFFRVVIKDFPVNKMATRESC